MPLIVTEISSALGTHRKPAGLGTGEVAGLRVQPAVPTPTGVTAYAVVARGEPAGVLIEHPVGMSRTAPATTAGNPRDTRGLFIGRTGAGCASGIVMSCSQFRLGKPQQRQDGFGQPAKLRILLRHAVVHYGSMAQPGVDQWSSQPLHSVDAVHLMAAKPC
jgi:hypothetical protein